MERGTYQGLGSAAAVVAVLLVACPAPEEPPACPVGEVEDIDTEECVPEHCGADTWGLIERTGETVHVAPWGDDSWDGSEEWPYRTIQQGADEAGDAGGGLVAVAAGTYVENLELDQDHDGVEIAGRCAELVVIDGSGAEEAGVRISRGELGLRNVTVAGGWRGIEVIASGFPASARLVARDLLLEGNHETGLLAMYTGTSVDLEGATVRDTQPRPDGTFGGGIAVVEGASLVARDLLAEGNHDFGLIVLDAGTSVELVDSTIRNTQPLPTGASGRGIAVQDGASLVAGGLALEGNHDVGLFAADAGTSVDLENPTVRDTQPRPDGRGGWGISVQLGASLVARGLLLEGNHHISLVASQAGTSVDLEAATIRDTQPLVDGTFCGGIAVSAGASLAARSVLFEENRGGGLGATGLGTEVSLNDVTVRDTQPLPDGTFGRGINVQEGASLVAQDLLLERNHEIGLCAAGLGTTVSLEDATVRGTRPLPDGSFGRGIAVQEGASLQAFGLRVEGNHEIGVRAGDADTTVILENSAVVDTLPAPGEPESLGVGAWDGASLFARRLLVEGNHGYAGLVVSGAGATVEIEDSTIRGTAAYADGSAGRGLAVQQGAALLGRGLLLESNGDIGLYATGAGTSVELDDLRVVGTRTPTNVAAGFGVVVQANATVAVLDLRVEDNEGPGLYVVNGGTLDAWDASLQRNGFAAAVVANGSLALHAGTVSGSTFHSGEGGGVGVFGWDLVGPPDIELDGVEFSDLPGPALYLRGPGRYVMRGCDIQDTGTRPWLPGGVLAVEGVQPWHEFYDTGYFTGLLLEGNTFSDLSSDAVLLDSSSATLDFDAEGAPNTFADLDGVPLVWQRCTDVFAPEILDGSISPPSCEPVPRGLGSLLEYRLWLAETDPVE